MLRPPSRHALLLAALPLFLLFLPDTPPSSTPPDASPGAVLLPNSALPGFLASSRRHRRQGMPSGDALLEFTNACVRGGADGIHVADTGWPDARTGYPAGTRKLPAEFSDPGTARRLLRGTTHLTNCWQQRRGDTNPAHVLMRASRATALLQVRREGKVTVPVFDRLAFHQCPSLASGWEWGRVAGDAAFAGWEREGMLAAGWAERRAEFHMEDRKKPENASAYSAPWICFERLFFDATYGRYFSSAEAWAEWRREALALLGLDEPPPPPEDRCINPRVAVYVRDPGSSANGNRAMVNLAEVLSALGNLTRRPIATISFTPATPVPDQALAFSSFGLLVTPRGSQLGNVGYLPLRNGRADAAIVEVSSFLREHTSHASGEGIGAPYVLSTEHIPVPGHSRSRSYRCHPRPEAFRAERCGRTGPQVSWWCSHGDGRSLLGCSLGVDVGVLLRDAGRALGWLCGNGTVVGGG